MTTSLVGRRREENTIALLLDGIGDSGAALVIEGEAGVGKSALLSAAAALAADRGLRVLRATGAPSEVNLSFAGLHQLLRPVLPLADALPRPQRNALLAAFGMADAEAGDRFLLALATLELLSAVAAHSPLVVIADDAHWLDQSSAEVLSFVARRIQNDHVIVVAAMRDDAGAAGIAPDVPRLRLAGLDEGPSHELLAARFPDMASAVRERLVAEAGGNPLALLELPAALSPAARDGESMLPPHLPLTARLERSFASRVAGLPAVTRALLLAAAADDGGLLGELLAAAGIAGGTPAALADLDPAVAVGLLTVAGVEVRFRHPLVRSAVYQAASVAERHRTHSALAEVFAADPDRRVWHLAAAATDRDPVVAEELGNAAARARTRGGLAVAAAAYERAAELAGDPGRRTVLLLQAADMALQVGQGTMAIRLLREADAGEPGPQGRTGVAEALCRTSPRDPGPVRILTAFVRSAGADGDHELGRALLTAAAMRCHWGNVTGEAVDELLGVAERGSAGPDDARQLFVEAFAAPYGRGASVLDRLARAGPPPDPQAALFLMAAANSVGAFRQALSGSDRAEARLRDQGRLGVLARFITARSWAAIWAGDLPAALTSADEAIRLTAETGQPHWEMEATAHRAIIAALRGDHRTAADLAARAEAAALSLGTVSHLALAVYARSQAALSDGRPAAAYKLLRRVHEPGDPAFHDAFAAFDLADLVEAATYSGHRDAARRDLRRAEALAERLPSPWLLATLGYARALLAADQDAECLFKEADCDEGMAQWPLLHARLRLAFGQWLRRQRRTAEARAALRAARDAFDSVGAAPWGERARGELLAAGEQSREPAAGPLDVLTPQELQIVQLAARGLSNGEIAQKLYLSRRTIESHLYRAFPKLGIASRAELPEVFAVS